MDYLPAWPLQFTPLLAFGLVLLVGALGGYLSHRVSWLPSITGFMLVGFLCGPSVLDLLSAQTIANSRVLIDIALALILFRLGLSLDIKQLRHSPSLIITSLVESGLTFGVVFGALQLFSVPFAISVLVAAITVSSSPAVLLHVAHEVNAAGVVTESTKTLVALNNLFSFIAFSAALPLLHYDSGANWTVAVFQPLYQLLGSLLLGLAMGWALHVVSIKTQSAAQYKLALVIGAIMMSIALASELKLSPLFAPLVMGVAIKTMERKAVTSDIEFGPAFELFFIVLFVFAGAGLHLHELIQFAPAVLALVLVRSLAKVIGATVMLRVFKKPLRSGTASGLLLIPMAGLAIGLVQTSSGLFPAQAPTIAAIVLGAVTVFETLGPPIAAFAFRFAGEAHGQEAEVGSEVQVEVAEAVPH
ncbi:Kef-type K+ transport system membrane component KefB [Polaromonas sp. CG_9.5]|uniref:cation:proton antiporter n=1 Tax=Polaromonas sp. CG_9.5 TaxID=3071705 RepID=UPI002E0041B8|nr:Kef-type K+ transport system membrane component KefB [Polaromonas sp. CG_9.5]